jgi:putative FmdB family regulatory protein
MPIYQYKCRNCGANVEKMQAFTAESLVECPECHQQTLKKVLSATGIIFRGSGWYITDSKKSSSAVAQSTEGSKGEGGKSDDAKSESSKSDSSKSGESAPAASNGDSKAGETKSTETKSSVPAPAASTSS